MTVGGIYIGSGNGDALKSNIAQRHSSHQSHYTLTIENPIAIYANTHQMAVFFFTRPS